MKIKALGYALTTFFFLNFSFAEALKEVDLSERLPAGDAPKGSIPAPSSVSVGASEAEQKKIADAMDPSLPHKKYKETIEAKCKHVDAAIPGFNPAGKYGKIAAKLKVQCDRYSLNRPDCDKWAWGAAKFCLAGRSIDIATVTTAVQTLSSAASFAIKDSCSMAAKSIDVIKKGMAGYAIACEGAKAYCDSVCGKTVVSLKEFKKYVADAGEVLKVHCTYEDLKDTDRAIVDSAPAAGPVKPPECTAAAEQLQLAVNGLNFELTEELDANELESLAGKEKICKIDFKNMLMAAAATTGSLVQSYFQASACDQQTAAQPTPLNCEDPKNANVPDCICLKNPRSQGCPNALVKAGGAGSEVTSSSVSSGMSSSLSTRGSLAPAGNAVDRDPAGVAQKPSSENIGGAQAGAPVGGGGGGAAGTDGKGGGSREMPGRLNKAGYNTNIMGGYDGGGGGGGRGGFRSELDAKRALANYRRNLNPTKVAAQAWTREVSPQGGRSNFEKVRARYNDNRRTLKGE